MTLTEAGRRLMAHGQGILRMLAEAKDDLSGQRDEPLGEIVVAMAPTQARLHTLALIETFSREMPRARLAIMEGFSVHLTEWLLSGRADLALVYNPEPLAALEIEPLMDEHLSLVSPLNAAPPNPISLAELPNYPLVLPQRGQIFRKLMESSAAMAGVRLNVAWEASSLPVILDLVSAGYGHAALSESAIRAFARPELLVVTPFKDAQIKSTLCLVTPAQKRSTRLIQCTSALLRQLATQGGRPT